ncbi:MAG: hypothetical protein TREMPRED_001918 [Tremellales sp. Tagirdzhanova-0007]|nr:MAG: hypothetical protein TREMPRED_001918 [Tremellales sp. Tagirdzhanova-0007]
MPPPLSHFIVNHILTHLLPPSLPLPPLLLSRSLLDRHTFIPPSVTDLDAHLSPLPSTRPISSLLRQLTIAHEQQGPVYAHDGEYFVARIRLLPIVDQGDGVDIIFEFEEREGGRGWVYRLARLSEELDPLQWEENLDAVEELRRDDKDDAVDEDGYWAGFNLPPATVIDLTDEEDYWAQYRANESGTAGTPVGVGTPGLGTPRLGTPGRGTPGLGTPELGHPGNKARKPTTSGRNNNAADSILRDKLLSTISVLLRQMWREFTSIAEGRTDVLEEKALTWLNVGREFTAIHRQETGGDVEVIRARAKMEVLSEMYEVLETEDGKNGFWRLIEEAIRTPLRAETPDDGGDAGQLGYWE